jgi:hypothetical protein
MAENTKMPTFADFRDGMGGDVCSRIGVDIAGIETWKDYTRAMVRHNDETEGSLVPAAKEFAEVAASSERAVLGAVLGAADFAYAADEMHCTTWYGIDRLGDTARLAIAAAILRKNG